MVKVIFNEDYVASCIRASKYGHSFKEGPDREFKKDEIITLEKMPTILERNPRYMEFTYERGEIFTVLKGVYEVIETVADLAELAAMYVKDTPDGNEVYRVLHTEVDEGCFYVRDEDTSEEYVIKFDEVEPSDYFLRLVRL